MHLNAKMLKSYKCLKIYYPPLFLFALSLFDESTKLQTYKMQKTNYISTRSAELSATPHLKTKVKGMY